MCVSIFLPPSPSLPTSLPLPPSLTQYPSVTLYPPHYDAVSSFAIHNNHLFSSCGCTFKQWDIEDKQIKQVKLVCLFVCLLLLLLAIPLQDAVIILLDVH